MTAKIAISLPQQVLEEIETRRRACGQTRSEFIRRAVEVFLRRERERELEEQYIRGYLEQPETEEDVAFARKALYAAMAESPWDEDEPA